MVQFIFSEALRLCPSPALKKLGFVESTGSVPWREAFPDLTDDQLPGTSLKGARAKEGLTQKQLAELTGIKQKSYF
jgi:hypothetical protein